MIGVSWDDTKLTEPFYFVRLGDYSSKLNLYDKKIKELSDGGSNFKYYDHGVKFYPDPKHFDIEGDFEKLINKFVKALS